MDAAERDPAVVNNEAQRSIGQRRTRARAAILAGITLTVLAVLAGCSAERTSIVAPKGPRAERIADLWWVMLVLAVAIFATFMILLLAALFRPRHDDDVESTPPGGRFFVPVAGIALPAVVLLAVFGMTVWTLRALEAPSSPIELTIDVEGNQWWWEASYPGYEVVTANEIHIPAGEPVLIRLASLDVIHSFWVPELAGKLDLVPGRINEFWIEAAAPGIYYVQCAEFCGLQHALMAFHVVADPPEEFAAWIAAQQQPADAPLTGSIVERGQDVFLSAGCIQCHTVRGTQATGQLGPDLTHLASRDHIAAGTLENTVGNLEAWISDPQAIKPGAKMPPTALDAEQLQALVAYLQSLE